MRPGLMLLEPRGRSQMLGRRETRGKRTVQGDVPAVQGRRDTGVEEDKAVESKGTCDVARIVPSGLGQRGGQGPIEEEAAHGFCVWLLGVWRCLDVGNARGGVSSGPRKRVIRN